MSIDIDKERADFEAWARDTGQPFAHFRGEQPSVSDWYYFHDDTDTAWTAWLAAKRAATQPAPIPGKAVRAGWTKTPPTEQGDYWHWTGDADHAPIIYHVMWSGSANKCFLSIGQYDIKEAIWCDKFGGWWRLIQQPAHPGDALAGGKGQAK